MSTRLQELQSFRTLAGSRLRPLSVEGRLISSFHFKSGS